jgi:glycosyltransferase involved in cell wall biosynthesis
MKFLVLIREPYLDKIPNLKTLIWYLSKENNEIFIISSREEKYPDPSFSNQNIKIILISKRSGKFELPTSLKLGWKFIKIYIRKNPKICIGGDTYGNILLGWFNIFLHFKHIFLMLEYPQVITKSHPQLSTVEKLEIKVLKQADTVITHDDFHKNFLINNLGIQAGKILILPNATFTKIHNYNSDFLHKNLELPVSLRIVLHSGGFGEWFRCKELAKSTDDWPTDFVLVFHTSHNVKNDEYFREIVQNDYKNKVFFSTDPVTTDKLDTLVCSADIGIALYSRVILDYRAELLGLAAGKIGNYLKCGLPIIATRLESFSYISDFECGILINDESEIPNAIKIIIDKYDDFSNNARHCYQELWEPERYLKKIKSHFENISK